MLTKMIISHDRIISAVAETKTHWVGFDPFSEDAATIEKSTSIELPQILITLISSEEARVKLAQALTGYNISKTAKILNVSERTLWRMRNRIKNKT